MIDARVGKKASARISQTISFLYIEKAIIEQSDYSIGAIRGNTITPIPIGSISCLILGPGTSITHRAIQAVAEAGCLLI